MANLKNTSISKLIPYVNNARTHDDAQIKQIASSIKEFGFNNPVLIDEKGGIIAGHGRVMAAQLLNIKEVPTIELSHLTDAQKNAYILADNRMALNAGWDIELLKFELTNLDELDFDLSLTGFDDKEIEEFLKEDLDPQSDEDAVYKTPEIPISKEGDVWILGNHRVMCGDSTSIDAVEKLMDGNVSDFGFCDPPYNLGFEYNDYDDNKSEKDYIIFSKLWFSNLQLYTERQAITLGTKNITIMAGLGIVAGVACWIKKNWITSCKIAKLQQWEPIFFFGDYTKIKRISDLYEVNRVVQKDVGNDHSCPKQIALIEDIFDNYAISSVLDLFLGSGTSVIACEKINKACYGLEVDPKYVDVIVKRWQEYTGKEAILESTSETFNSLGDDNG